MTDLPSLAALPAVEDIRNAFSSRGFTFADGTLKSTGQKRAMGVSKGATLELVGEQELVSATMVSQIAPDDLDMARLNGIRLAALMGLVTGSEGVTWIGEAMKFALGRDPGKLRIKDRLKGWDLQLVVNRRASTITLKVQRS